MDKKIVVASVIALCAIVAAVALVCFVPNNDDSPVLTDTSDYLSFYFPDGGTIEIQNHGKNEVVCYYSLYPFPVSSPLDDIVWSEFENDKPLEVPLGQMIFVKGNNVHGFSISETDYTSFVFTGKVKANGNVMSLIDADKNPDLKTIPNGFCFYALFKDCKTLMTAPELPATKLNRNCYESMFEGCVLLEKAPKLPATEVSTRAYVNMFRNCESLCEVTCNGVDVTPFNVKGWLDGVSETGHFRCRMFEQSYHLLVTVPEGWEIVNIVK